MNLSRVDSNCSTQRELRQTPIQNYFRACAILKTSKKCIEGKIIELDPKPPFDNQISSNKTKINKLNINICID